MARVTVTAQLDGARFDVALARLFPDLSRSRLARLADTGAALLNGAAVGRRQRVRAGDTVEVSDDGPTLVTSPADQVDFAVAHRDADTYVIDKPAGLVVHPGAGNPRGTLMNGLLAFDPTLATLPRAGIIHRLDKHTSGLVVVARHPAAHAFLVAALAERRIHREYLAEVEGVIPALSKPAAPSKQVGPSKPVGPAKPSAPSRPAGPVAGGHGGDRFSIEAPIGPDRSGAKRQVVDDRHGQPARTDVYVVERRERTTLVRCVLHSGRTHQIRVHLAHAGHPLVGDELYGGGARPDGSWGQALHACTLRFPDRNGGPDVEVTSEPPAGLA